MCVRERERYVCAYMSKTVKEYLTKKKKTACKRNHCKKYVYITDNYFIMSLG